MIGAWMLYTLVVSTLIAGAAVIAERAARELSLRTRSIWTLALLAAATTSALSWRAKGADGQAAFIPARIAAPAAAGQKAIVVTSGEGTRATSSRPAATTNEILGVAWLLMSCVVIGAFASSALQLRRRRARWTRAQVAGIEVLVTDGLGPAVIGFFRPVIAAPGWAMRESAERLQMIVLHEDEHRRAGDQYLRALSLAMLAALPWNVAVWWMARRLRHAVELDCDARVMARKRDLRGYGQLLIDVSRRPVSEWSTLTAFSESPSSLERRIMELTRAASPHARTLAAGFVGLSALVILVACELPRPTGPGAPSPLAARAASGYSETFAPLPKPVAGVIDGDMTRDFPDVKAKGLEKGKVLWYVYNRDGQAMAHWIGTELSSAEFKKMALEPRFDSLHLVTYHASLTAANGASVPAIVAGASRDWMGSEYLVPTQVALLRDSIRVLEPAMYAAGTPAGKAVYVLMDWQAKTVTKIWAGPLDGDRKTQWDFARLSIPERALVFTTNLQLTTDAGRPLNVVYVTRVPWAKRYG